MRLRFERADGSITVAGVEISARLGEPRPCVGVSAGRVILEYTSGSITAYGIGPEVEGGLALYAMVYCSHGGTQMASIEVTPVEEIEGLEVSPDARRRIRERHDEILREQLGTPPYVFEWGVVESVDDPRALQPNIVIKYR